MASLRLTELILHIGWQVVGKPRKQSGEMASLNYSELPVICSGGTPLGGSIDRFRIVNMEIDMLLSRWFLWITFHRCLWTIALLLIISTGNSMAENATHKFKLVVLAEAGGIHRPFVDAAKVWLDKQAAGNSFSVDYIQDTDKIDDVFLSR